ncbi:hypothetical protein [Bilophila wadsworthia]|nr:hypothetical protein [Bilophila wadsworthia]
MEKGSRNIPGTFFYAVARGAQGQWLFCDFSFSLKPPADIR